MQRVTYSTIMDKFLWDTCFYLSQVHIFDPGGASPLPT